MNYFCSNLELLGSHESLFQNFFWTRSVIKIYFSIFFVETRFGEIFDFKFLQRSGKIYQKVFLSFKVYCFNNDWFSNASTWFLLTSSSVRAPFIWMLTKFMENWKCFSSSICVYVEKLHTNITWDFGLNKLRTHNWKLYFARLRAQLSIFTTGVYPILELAQPLCFPANIFQRWCKLEFGP